MSGVEHLFTAEVVLGGVSLGEFERVERVGIVAGVAKVVAVQVHRVWETEMLVCLDETLDYLCRGDIEVRNRVVDVLTVQPPSPGLGYTGIDGLDGEPPGCTE